MKVTIDLPDTTTAVSLSYIFSDDNNENLLIGSSILTESALKSGCFECKGSVNNAKTEAYKEFAELMKANKITVDVSNGYGRATFTEAVTVLEIDRILEEKVNNE